MWLLFAACAWNDTALTKTLFANDVTCFCGLCLKWYSIGKNAIRKWCHLFLRLIPEMIQPGTKTLSTNDVTSICSLCLKSEMIQHWQKRYSQMMWLLFVSFLCLKWYSIDKNTSQKMWLLYARAYKYVRTRARAHTHTRAYTHTHARTRAHTHTHTRTITTAHTDTRTHHHHRHHY